MLVFYLIGYILACDNNHVKLTNVWMCRCINVCAIFLIAIMCLNIKQDLPMARAYFKAHQEREAYLLELQEKGNTETVVVTPYPSTHTPDAKYNVLRLFGKKTNMQAIYYEADTDIEPNEYEYHVRKWLRLDFNFVLAPKNE